MTGKEIIKVKKINFRIIFFGFGKYIKKGILICFIKPRFMRITFFVFYILQTYSTFNEIRID